MNSKFRVTPHKLGFLLLALTSGLLMVFNSCQGPMGIGKGFKASAMCNSKPGLVRKLDLSISEKQQILKSQQSIFDGNKLQLGASSGVSAKASDPVLPMGTNLTVIVDNECVEALRHSSSTTAFSGPLTKDRTAIGDLQIQSYDYTLEKNWISSEFEKVLNEDVCVKGVTYNQTYSLSAVESFSLNDPFYGQQKHFAAVKAQNSYSKFYSDDGGMDKSQGTPVVVAVIDTGIDWNHPDLQQNMWKYSPTDWGLNAPTLTEETIDYNPHDDDEYNGHGTHVSGLIAAAGNNAVGTSGLMPHRANIMAIKVFKVVDMGGGATSLQTNTTIVTNAIIWAVDQGAQVINLSLARLVSIDPSSPGSGRDPAYENALQYALNAGVFVVAAAGNMTGSFPAQEINDTNFTSLPARYGPEYAGMMSVGSFNTESGTKADFSHWGTKYVEITAPGTQRNENGSANGIFSTVPTWVGQKTGYGVLSGTSMSAPMVAAAAALTIGLIRDAYDMVPNPAEIERLITISAEKSSQLSPYFKDGNRLNLLGLVAQINKDYPLTRGVVDGSTDSLDMPSVGCP